MKTEGEMRAVFEQRCIDHLKEKRAAGVHIIDDNGAHPTIESLFWKQPDGTYGVLMFNTAWIGYQWGVVDTARDRAAVAVAAEQRVLEVAAKPIDMILYCPNCGDQHVDAPSPVFEILQREGITCQPSLQDPDALEWSDGIRRTYPWTNPPHRSHLCHSCGCIWRPADVPTNGVAEIKTEGKADTWPVNPGEVVAAEAKPGLKP